jgi:hypothetical protein
MIFSLDQGWNSLDATDFDQKSSSSEPALGLTEGCEEKCETKRQLSL